MNRWMPAFESQLHGITLLERCLRDDSIQGRYINLEAGFKNDLTMLRRSTPFYWSADAMEAVHAASHKIDYDVKLDKWNLDVEAAWWYFEQPIPMRTTTSDSDLGIRALCMGWVMNAQQHKVTGETRVHPEFWISVWVDTTDIGICASQTFTWTEGETVDELIYRLSKEYQFNYGPTGPFAKENNTIGVEQYVLIATLLTKFILAGLAWLGQKIVTETEGTIQRQRRKSFQKIVGHDPSLVRVIELRKREKTAAGDTETDREWTHRWIVDGHWRNARVGPNREARRLTWVHPYIKGPEDKPFIPKEKIYVVDR